MRGISSGSFFIIFGFILLIEVLCFFAIFQLVKGKAAKKTVSVVYWLITLIFIVFWLSAFINPSRIRETTDYSFFYFVIFISSLNLIPKILMSVFLVLSVPFRLIKDKTFSKAILLGGIILSLGTIIVMGYGATLGRKSIRIEEVELKMPSLPAQLEGLKIVHISDFHMGGFHDDRFPERLVAEINNLTPDLILFTGDMVNNFSQEMEGFEATLQRLQARYGKLAILGNHDYGDYSKWKTEDDRTGNRLAIRQKIENSGFQLLLNQSQRVAVGDTSLYIVGVENWGKPPFPQYADLGAALSNVPDNSFRILMSHDPDHWPAQVLHKTDIPLTLSGHSHGGQLAFKIAGIEFSPIRRSIKKWGGLYGHQNQFLYVNRGLGCVGLPARIDMNPEITILKLTKEDKTPAL